MSCNTDDTSRGRVELETSPYSVDNIDNMNKTTLVSNPIGGLLVFVSRPDGVVGLNKFLGPQSKENTVPAISLSSE